MAEAHSSKGIMVGVIVVAVILLAVVVPFSMTGSKPAPAADDREEVLARIQPVARVDVKKAAAPAAAAGAPKDGATVFNTVCGACHNTGAAGAPKAGDKAAWAPRIAQGKETLYKSALNGKNAMPPKGGVASLSDAEVKAAVDFLVGKAQ
ncbi:MAG TPA: c-type cytochrome [Rhodocyclaceae bacterium]|nr:c-type cytochrome [Rhodocyclaceae bacterium]